MGILDTLLGRTKPKEANLEDLFALPSAAVTLSASLGLTSSGTAAVCVKSPGDREETEVRDEIGRLLSGATTTVETTTDAYGYRWFVVADPDLSGLVTAVHVVNTTLVDHGWSTQLLCSAFGFHPGEGADQAAKPVTLVYLFKRGTFYPFCQVGHEVRDTTTELLVKATLGADLPMETDLTRWMAIWDAPVR